MKYIIPIIAIFSFNSEANNLSSQINQSKMKPYNSLQKDSAMTDVQANIDKLKQSGETKVHKANDNTVKVSNTKKSQKDTNELKDSNEPKIKESNEPKLKDSDENEPKNKDTNEPKVKETNEPKLKDSNENEPKIKDTNEQKLSESTDPKKSTEPKKSIEKDGNSKDSDQTNTNSDEPLKQKKSAPYPNVSAQKDNSPASSVHPFPNMSHVYKDNSPAATATHYMDQVKIEHKNNSPPHADYPLTTNMDFDQAANAPKQDKTLPAVSLDSMKKPKDDVLAPYTVEAKLPYKYAHKDKESNSSKLKVVDNTTKLQEHMLAKPENKDTECEVGQDGKKACNEEKNKSQTVPQDFTTAHKDNSPKSDKEKPQEVKRKVEKIENARINTDLESMSDLNQIRDQYEIIRIKYNTLLDTIADTKEKLSELKAEDSKKANKLELEVEVAEEKKRKLTEDQEFLNSKQIIAENQNTSLKAENLSLQKKLSELSNTEALAEATDRNRKATLDKDTAEMEILRKRNSQLLREKVELQVKLDSEVAARKKQQEKSGSLRASLDQELTTNELLKHKLTSNMSKDELASAAAATLKKDSETKESEKIQEHKFSNEEQAEDINAKVVELPDKKATKELLFAGAEEVKSPQDFGATNSKSEQEKKTEKDRKKDRDSNKEKMIEQPYNI